MAAELLRAGLLRRLVGQAIFFERFQPRSGSRQNARRPSPQRARGAFESEGQYIERGRFLLFRLGGRSGSGSSICTRRIVHQISA